MVIENQEELEIQFLEMIKTYLKNVAQTAQIFKEEFGVEPHDLARARFEKTIPLVGSIKHRGIKHFNYHGIGLCAEFTNKVIDFDFYDENGVIKIDGFDSWRLYSFADNYKEKYKDFQNEKTIKALLNELAIKEIIIRPDDPYSSLWVLNVSDNQ